MLERIAEKSGLYDKLESYTPGSGHGIGILFYNHGAGFTGNGEQEIIKAKLKMVKHPDDTVDILLSNVEMGQGLQTTFRRSRQPCWRFPYRISAATVPIHPGSRTPDPPWPPGH